MIEYLIIYAIVATSFAVMYHFRYFIPGFQLADYVAKEWDDTLELPFTEKVIMHCGMLGMVILTAPLFIIVMFLEDRDDAITNIAEIILHKLYGFQK